MIPYRGVRGDVYLPWSFPIPIINRQLAPLGLFVSQHRLQGGPAFPFEPGATCLTRGTWGWGIIEGSIEPQARDHTDAGQPHNLVEPFQGRTTAVRPKDDLTTRQPAPHEPDDLPGSFQQGLMAAALLCIEALGGAQHGHKGQGPDPVGPCDGGQHHTPEPAQATDFDNISMRGAYGITVDAFRGNLIAAAAFDGVIQAKDDAP